MYPIPPGLYLPEQVHAACNHQRPSSDSCCFDINFRGKC